jgi:STE24 endopeptidase
VVILIFTFLVNLILVASFWGLVQLFQPLAWPWLFKLMSTIHVPVTALNQVLTLSVLTLLIPCLASKTALMQRYFCWVLHCTQPKGAEADLLQTALTRVCRAAGLHENDFELFVCQSKDYNAFAVGDNYIAVTKPLLTVMPAGYLAGILAHEVGHIRHNDTLILYLCNAMSSFGNLVLRFYLFITLLLGLLSFIPLVGIVAGILSWFFLIQIYLFRFLLQLPLQLAHLFNSRRDEYAADRYACEVGLGLELYNGLMLMATGQKKLSFWRRLTSDHPDTDKRLAKILAYEQKENPQLFAGK